MPHHDRPSPAPASANLWSVWRTDDNGNTFVVREHLRREEAKAVAEEFEARGHKQMYWIEPERDNTSTLDSNANAGRIVAQTTADEAGQPPDLEAAWLAWSAHIQNVDERGRTLLRAAFEAGWEAGNPSKARDPNSQE